MWALNQEEEDTLALHLTGKEHLPTGYILEIHPTTFVSILITRLEKLKRIKKNLNDVQLHHNEDEWDKNPLIFSGTPAATETNSSYVNILWEIFFNPPQNNAPFGKVVFFP